MPELKILEKLNKIDAKVINNNKKIHDIENKLEKCHEYFTLLKNIKKKFVNFY